MKKNYIYNKVIVKVFTYLLPLTSCLFMSCSDFLDILPMNSTVLENYWKEKADVTGASCAQTTSRLVRTSPITSTRC